MKSEHGKIPETCDNWLETPAIRARLIFKYETCLD